MRVTEFPLNRLDPDKSNSFDPLYEAVALGTDKNLQVEIIQEDCRFKFFDEEWSPNLGDVLDISDAAATFLVLKGWGRIASP
jgi:hypothetical protein